VRLRAARENAGLSREVVAVSTHKAFSTIVQYERTTLRAIEPPARVLMRLAELYGCALEDFFDEEPEAVAQ
jgi:transcriptional regulator with XRE-family HTH domain